MYAISKSVSSSTRHVVLSSSEEARRAETMAYLPYVNKVLPTYSFAYSPTVSIPCVLSNSPTVHQHINTYFSHTFHNPLKPYISKTNHNHMFTLSRNQLVFFRRYGIKRTKSIRFGANALSTAKCETDSHVVYTAPMARAVRLMKGVSMTSCILTSIGMPTLCLLNQASQSPVAKVSPSI